MHESNASHIGDLIRALTAEVPNYADYIAKQLLVPVTDIWALYLQKTGHMNYASCNDTGSDTEVESIAVPSSFRDGPSNFTRQTLYRAALECVIDALGDPEARYRTSADTALLRRAITEFFGAE